MTYVVRLEFQEIKNAKFVQKRIKQELGLDFLIGEEATPFEDRELMEHNRKNEKIVKKQLT